MPDARYRTRGTYRVSCFANASAPWLCRTYSSDSGSMAPRMERREIGHPAIAAFWCSPWKCCCRWAACNSSASSRRSEPGYERAKKNAPREYKRCIANLSTDTIVSSRRAAALTIGGCPVRRAWVMWGRQVGEDRRRSAPGRGVKISPSAHDEGDSAARAVSISRQVFATCKYNDILGRPPQKIVIFTIYATRI